MQEYIGALCLLTPDVFMCLTSKLKAANIPFHAVSSDI